MKNDYFKKALFSAGLAVMAGVLVFGVNAAIGAPSVSPPGAGVSPTFTGLTSTGNVKVDGKLDVKTDLNVTGDIAVNDLDATGAVRADLGLVSQKGLIVNNALSQFYDDASILGNLLVTGNIDLTKILSVNTIKNRTIDPNDPITFDANIDVKKLNASGGIYSSKPLTGISLSGNYAKNQDPSISIDRNLYVGSNQATIGTVFYGDDAEITSRFKPLTLNGTWGKSVDIGSASTSAPLHVTGQTTLKGADVNGSGGGSLKIPSGSNWLAIDNNELATYGDNLYLNIDSGKDVYVGGVGNSNLIVKGKVTATGGFGTYSLGVESDYSAFVYVAPSAVAKASKTCGALALVSCEAVSYKTQSASDKSTGDTNFIGIYSESGTCYVEAKNTNATRPQYIRAKAVCLDPTK